MAPKASFAALNEAESILKGSRSRAKPSSQLNSSNANYKSLGLSAHQKTLLAEFGVNRLKESTSRCIITQRRAHCLIGVACPPESITCHLAADPETERQDRPDPEVLKGVALAIFLPTFNIPSQNFPTSTESSTMDLGGFDRSKYGAPPRKRKSVNRQTKPQDDAVPVASHEEPKVIVSEVPPAQVTSGVVPQPPRTETASVTGSSQTQPTEVSTTDNGSKNVVPKPKSTNKISIPGFNPSKYGKPSSKASRDRVQNEVQVTIGDAEDQAPTNESLVIENQSTSLPQFQTNDPSTSSRSEIDHPPRLVIDDEVKSRHHRSSTAGTTKTVSQISETSTMAAQLPPRSGQMMPTSLPPPIPGMSKEERLKQIQQASLQQIRGRQKTRGATQDTTLKGLQDARTPAGPGSYAAPALRAPSPSEQYQAKFTSPTVASPIVSQNDKSSTLRTHQPVFPPPLPGMSKEERLKQVQQVALRQIGVRNRTKGGDPETTSLMDLQLARTPALSESLDADLTTTDATAVNSRCSINDKAALPETKITNDRAEHQELFSQPPVHPLRAVEDAPGGHLSEMRAQGRGVDDVHATAYHYGISMSAASKVIERKSRNPRWCTPEEIRATPNLETNSNAWGSDIPSNASVASNDSTRPMQLHGRLFNGPPAGDLDEVAALIGWDGKIQPPPVDWNDRPRFNNNSPAFKNGFNNWFATTAAETSELVDTTSMFRTIPKHVIENREMHADGISMVPKDYTLNALNVSKYGYTIEPVEVAKFAEPVNAEDFSDWGKLDMREPGNVKFKDETTEQLVKNWIAHQQKSKKNTTTLATMHGNRRSRESKALKPEDNSNKPLLNIYLRPAVKTDMKQLTDLYNWGVENSVRPAETRAIELSDMRERFNNSKDDKLPFIVAILKGRKDVPRDQYTGIAREQIVGFAVATGFTALDYVEHIAAELEVYVHHDFRRMGVGNCLLDRLLCATDRGHMERGGYPFHCDPAERHWYEVGGARNLHKLAFVVRHHSRPQKDSPAELDVMTWIKRWLVKEWDFEEEACLKQIGAKDGRFIDITYFSKFSKWLPEDGRVPDPEPKDHKHQA